MRPSSAVGLPWGSSLRLVRRSAGRLRGGAGPGRRGGVLPCDQVGEVGGVVGDEAEQRRPTSVLPRQAKEVQARHLGDAAAVDDLAFTHHPRDLDPGVVGAVAGGPHHHPDVLQQAVVGEPDGASLGVDQPRPEPHAGLAQPAPVGPDHDSRRLIRWPGRELTVTRSRPSRVSHQNRSRPAGRWGSIGYLVAIDRSTWRVAASSSAIWNPEFPPPTTSTGPSGRAWGLRYSALCTWVTEPSSFPAGGGTKGTWNGPVA